MYNVKLWQDEILDIVLTTASATGNGSQTGFVISAAPLFIVKVTVNGARVSDWYYNRATHTVVFDSAPANGAAILFHYLPEIQKGTDINAANLNDIDFGILDNQTAIGLLTARLGQISRDTEVEEKTLTLTNNQVFPFNSTVDSPVSVSLTKRRNHTDYQVDCEVTSHTGEVGEIIVSDKALNGFKISFDGSGTSVSLRIRVIGGLA